jgi:hypothetical protein
MQTFDDTLTSVELSAPLALSGLITNSDKNCSWILHLLG